MPVPTQSQRPEDVARPLLLPRAHVQLKYQVDCVSISNVTRVVKKMLHRNWLISSSQVPTEMQHLKCTGAGRRNTQQSSIFDMIFQFEFV
ncbi:hypothetical protein FHG87_002057 [Trinorchestia longiramus]|nr:hypothetical protein FHG87_002057 [Trinorchestia longiramus]